MMKGSFIILILAALVIIVWGVNEYNNAVDTGTLTPVPTPAPPITPPKSPTGTISTVYTTPSIDPENNVYWATAYNTVVESELEGTQKVTTTISGSKFSLKASFLYGGFGVAMQGIGKTGPHGTCIQHISSKDPFVHLNDPLEFTDAVRSEYAKLGITDFSGFGPLALSSPGTSEYVICSRITGSSDRDLIPWYSIATDPNYIPIGTTGTLIFEDGKPSPSGSSSMQFRADDTGGAIIGKRIDIYIGEGEAALTKWYITGGNRYVRIYTDNGTYALNMTDVSQ